MYIHQCIWSRTRWCTPRFCFLLTQFSSFYCTSSLYDHNRKGHLSATKIVWNKRFYTRMSITKSQGLGTSRIGLMQKGLHPFFHENENFRENVSIWTKWENFYHSLCAKLPLLMYAKVFGIFPSLFVICIYIYMQVIFAKMLKWIWNEDFCFILRHTLRTFKHVQKSRPSIRLITVQGIFISFFGQSRSVHFRLWITPQIWNQNQKV